MNALTQELVELLSLEKIEENIFFVDKAVIWLGSVFLADKS